MTDGERLVKVETGVKYIVRMLEGHIEQPSCQVCKLNDDVVKLNTHLRFIKWAGGVFMGVTLTALSKNWMLALINMWR
jgi:hypothetical protein